VPLRDDLKEQIKVIVRLNDSEEEFFVVPALLCHHSDYFKAACKDQWEFGRNKEICIHEEDPRHFAVFLAFVYTGKVEIPDKLLIPNGTLHGKPDAEEKKQGCIKYLQLVRCFALGSFLQSHTFQNAVMDSIHAEAESYAQKFKSLVCTTNNHINEVYRRTTEGSALRRYVVQTVSKNAGPDHPTFRLRSRTYIHAA
jgi:hypothetical protein